MHLKMSSAKCQPSSVYLWNVCVFPFQVNGSDSEEEECALSDKWVMEPGSRRWSRKLDHVIVQPEPPTDTWTICGKPKTEDQKPYSPSTWPPPVTPPGRTESNPPQHRTAQQLSISPRLRRAASERWKGAKTFLKRFESIKSTRPNKNVEPPSPEKLEIGSPVITDVDKMREVMDRLGCREIVRKSSDPGPLLGQYSGPSSPGGSVGGSNSPLSSHSTTPDLLSLEPGYKPGTFPKILDSETELTNGHNSNHFRYRKFSLGSLHLMEPPSPSFNGGPYMPPSPESLPESPLWRPNPDIRGSVYDNVPDDPVSVQDRVHVQEELDLILSDLLQNIKDLGLALEEPGSQKDTGEAPWELNASMA